jgi:hypothetical protein
MAKVKTTFKYKIPDQMYLTSRELKREATWTYVGERFWQADVRGDGHIDDFTPLRTISEFSPRDHEDGIESMIIDATDSSGAMIACMWNGQDSDLSDSDKFSHLSVTLPNGLVHKELDPSDPLHTYVREKVKYDFNNETWTWGPFIGAVDPAHAGSAQDDWEGLRAQVAATRMIYTDAQADSEYWNGLSAEEQQEWATWDSGMSVLVDKCEADPNVYPWMVRWPDWPNKDNGEPEDSA